MSEFKVGDKVRLKQNAVINDPVYAAEIHELRRLRVEGVVDEIDSLELHKVQFAEFGRWGFSANVLELVPTPMTQQQPDDNASALTEAKAEFELAKQITITEMMRSGIVTEGASRRIGNAATAYIAALEAELTATRAQLAATGALEQNSLLHSLQVAAEFFWAKLPDNEVVSVGTWSEPVPGWHSVFNAELKLTLGEIRAGLSATPPAGAEEDGR